MLRKKYFSSIALLFSLLFFICQIAAADPFADQLVHAQFDRKTLDEIYKGQSDAVIGNQKNPSIIVVDFFDPTCPYCRKGSAALRRLVAHDRRVEIIFMEYPVLSETSERLSTAAYAAAKQGKYVAMHEAIMASDGPFEWLDIYRLAGTAHLDLKKFKQDVKDSIIAKRLARNATLAEQFSVQAVPTLIVAHAKIRTGKSAQYIWTDSLDDPGFPKMLNWVAKS